jgi:2-polyprenyl-3-methyl-5-hydroxy-6-metoxy-1,4-benzoquinol methylase
MNEIQKWKNHAGAVLESVDGFDVIQCKTCGFAHVIPLRDEQQHAQFYEEEFYQGKENYIETHTQDLEWRTIEYNEKYDFFEQQLADRSSKRILDIGSGPGYFLKTGKDRGWDVTGIEPGKPAYLFSTEVLGLNVFNEFFSSKNYKRLGKFDVIHMNNVLEHIPDPQQFLMLTHEILEPAKLICVTVPNDYNPLQKVVVTFLNKNPWWVVPKEHVNYFDFESLSRLMEEVGFKTIYTTSSFPLELFLLMGEDYIGNRQIGRKIHKKRKNFERAMAETNNTNLKRQIYNKLSELGLGREITIIGKKQ